MTYAQRHAMGGYEMKMHIVDAANELAATCAFDDISVIDICQASTVSRQTFYNHFKNKIDMLCWERSTVLNDFFFEYSSVCGWNETLAILLEKDSHVNHLLRRVTQSKDNPIFLRYCVELYEAIFDQELRARGIVKTRQYEFYIHYGAWIMGHCLDDWYRSGCELDLKMMLGWLDDMTPDIMREMREQPVDGSAKRPF